MTVLRLAARVKGKFSSAMPHRRGDCGHSDYSARSSTAWSCANRALLYQATTCFLTKESDSLLIA